MQVVINTTATFQLVTQPFEGLCNPPAEQIQLGSLQSLEPLPPCGGSGTSPAVPAQPTHIPVPQAASPLHQSCCCPWIYRRGQGAFPDLSAYTRSHAAIRISFLPPVLYWNSVEPTLLPYKANKFNYVVMCLSEQAPTKLTGIKHLLYTTLNQNLF